MTWSTHEAYEQLCHLDPDIVTRDPDQPATFRSPFGGLDLVLRVLVHRGPHTELWMRSPQASGPPCRELRIELHHDLQEAQAYEYRTGGLPSTVAQSRDGTFPSILAAWLHSVQCRHFRLIGDQDAQKS